MSQGRRRERATDGRARDVSERKGKGKGRERSRLLLGRCCGMGQERGEGVWATWRKKGGGKGMARWAGLPRTRRKEGVGVGPWLSSGRDSGRR